MTDWGSRAIAVMCASFIAVLEYFNLPKGNEWEFIFAVACIAGLGGFTHVVELVQIWKSESSPVPPSPTITTLSAPSVTVTGVVTEPLSA